MGQSTSANNVVLYLTERSFGFSYPVFARENNITVPDDFWPFWQKYYITPLSARAEMAK